MSFKQLAKVFDGSFAIVVGAVLAVLLVQQVFSMGWATQAREASVAPAPVAAHASSQRMPLCAGTSRIASQPDCLAQAASVGPILR